MPKLKPGTIIPSVEEDKAINAGIAADPDTHEWSENDFRTARPARDFLPGIVGGEVASEMLRPRGRPRSAAPKLHLNVRLDADVVRAFKEGGPGWQTRMNDVLKEWVRKHGF